MAKLKPARPKRSPQRTCVACRQVQDKRSMVRIVRTGEGIVVDPTSKLSGRGAYLHAQKDCWSRGLGQAQTGKAKRRSSPVEQALRAKMTDEEREDLHKYLENTGDASQNKHTVIEETADAGHH